VIEPEIAALGCQQRRNPVQADLNCRKLQTAARVTGIARAVVQCSVPAVRVTFMGGSQLRRDIQRWIPIRVSSLLTDICRH
jgi:hypothetical protein